MTIGHNLPPAIATADDARAYAAAINALRVEAERIRGEYKERLAELEAAAKIERDDRDGRANPLETQAQALRKVLSDWLVGDPDGSLRDGERIVATLARKVGKPQIHADQLPPEYLSLQPNIGAINAALAQGIKVPGVVVTVETSLRVLA